jgi:hypothetical protein
VAERTEAMRRYIFRKLVLSCVVFGAFYVSGHLAMYLENYHDSILASSAVFGVSFVGLATGILKVYTDLFT